MPSIRVIQRTAVFLLAAVFLGAATPALADTLTDEWKEVKSKYPNVARAYVDLTVALDAARAQAEKSDAQAYQRSKFATLLVNACKEGSVIVARAWLCEGTQPTVRPPGNQCHSCGGVCSDKVGSPVDCTACREERANLGCF